MADITINTRETDTGWECDVTVSEGDSKSEHTVTITRDYRDSIAEGVAPETLVRASFSYLLERESKESILSSFNLQTIEDYFPGYPDDITEYL